MADTTIDRVQIEIEATAKGVSAVFSQLESQMNTIKQALGSLDTSKISKARQALNGGLDMSTAEKNVVKSLDKIKQALAGLDSYKKAALSGDGSAATSFERQTTRIQSQIDILGEKLKQLGDNRLGISVDSDAFQAYREELAEIQSSLNNSKMEMPTPSPEPTLSGFELIKAKAAEAGSAIVKGLGTAAKNAAKNLKSGLSKVSDALSKIKNGALGAAEGGFKKLLKYVFGIRSMYVLFRRLRSAIQDSFGELQKSGAFVQTTRANLEGLKASLSTLKYQFGAAFEPIFNAVAPALQTLIDYLVTAMNVLSAFFAKLMGKSTYSRAVAGATSLGKATGGAAKAQKDLNKQLQGFDELNNLTTNDSSGGGGGGGAGGSGSNVHYVEESVDNVLGDFGKELAEKIREGDWRGVGQAISDKLSEAMESIPWDKVFEWARDFGKNLAEFLNGLINPRLFANVGITIANAINTAFEFLNSFGKNFDWQNFGESIGAGITAWFETADFALWGDTVHTWLAGLLDAGIALVDNTDWELIGEKLADFLTNLDIPDLAGKLFSLAKKIASGLATAIESLWKNSDTKTKIGLAIVGLLAVANLTGLSAKLGGAITSYLAAHPLVLGKIALLVTEAKLVFDGTRWVLGNVAEDLGDDELAEEYRTFTWSNFWETIQKPDGSGIDWEGIKEAWSEMCADYFEPLFEEIDYWKDEAEKKFVDGSLWIAEKIGLYKPEGHGGGTSFGEGEEESSNDSGSSEMSVSIKSAFQGAFKSPKDFSSFAEKWDKFKKNFKDVKNNIKSKASGAFQKITDIDTWKQKFSGLKQTWTDKTAEIKGKLGGVFSKIVDVDSLKEKYKSLKDSWTEKTSTLKANVGGAISKITDLDTWKGKITDLKNNWTDKSNTLKSSVGGAISRITDLDTWKGKMTDLKNNWSDKSATLKASLGGAISNITSLDTWKSKITDLKNSWVGKSATFALSQTGTAISTLVDKITALKDSWKDKAATFSLKFSAAASDLKSWVNTNVIDKINAKFAKVPILNKVKIPKLAVGAVLDESSLVNIGEAGAEAVIPLERNLNGIKMIANTLLDGMEQSATLRYSASPSNYGNGLRGSASGIQSGSQNNVDNQLLTEQNALLQEQNRLLQQIANKNVTISSRDVFSATQGEANNYYNRTGNSPFLF